MTNNNLSEIKNIVSKIAERYGVSKVLLFGSRVKGEERSDSDYDFLITNGNLNSLLQFSGFWLDLEEAFQSPVDVIILNRIYSSFLFDEHLGLLQQKFCGRKRFLFFSIHFFDSDKILAAFFAYL